MTLLVEDDMWKLPVEGEYVERETNARPGGRTSDRNKCGIKSFILGDRRTLEYEPSGLRVSPAADGRDEEAVPERERFGKIDISIIESRCAAVIVSDATNWQLPHPGGVRINSPCPKLIARP
jgi:hypothetical protein